MSGYRRFGSRLQGHPTPVLPWVDVATGSLGQGLPDGVGVALAGKYLDRLPFRVWVLCGDSEMAEGSMWEALDKASHYQLSNLVAIVDVNRLGQRGPTELGWDLGAYARRARAFGARVLEIDGHDLAAIDDALSKAAQTDGRPTVILARTIKGRGFSEVEDREGWHGKAFRRGHGGASDRRAGRGEQPDRARTAPAVETRRRRLGARGKPGDRACELCARGQGRHPPSLRRRVTALGARDPRVVALDGEVSNSTYADAFAKAHPDRYFEMFIAEQQMVASAVGLSVRGYKPFASTFAAFLTRAYDFIRMAAISQASVRLVGSHAGVEIGADGPSQMALEDLAMMRAVQGSTVLYPSDAVSTAALVDEMARTDGISYLRTTRGAYPVLYGAEESFRPAARRSCAPARSDAVTLIGAGVTLHECLRAADQLALDGIHARVIDLYSIKPIDTDTLVAAADATGGRLVVAEDHHPEGGLGSAVAAALLEAGVQQLRLAHLSVSELPALGHAGRATRRRRHRRPAHRIGRRRVDRRMMISAQPRNPRGGRKSASRSQSTWGYPMLVAGIRRTGGEVGIIDVPGAASARRGRGADSGQGGGRRQLG